MSEQKAKIQPMFDYIRTTVRNALASGDRYRDLIEIAERYEDYDNLVELLFVCHRTPADVSKSSMLIDATDPFHAEIQLYIDTYGPAFANALFQYYIDNDCFSELLSTQDRNLTLLEAYFMEKDDPAGISWLVDIRVGNFSHAAEKLEAYLSRPRDRDADMSMNSVASSNSPMLHPTNITSYVDDQASKLGICGYCGVVF